MKTLLVVSPFVRLDVANLGVHILQACARKSGHEVSICYGNMLFSRMIGEDIYQAICHAPESLMLGEKIFARQAYDVPLLGRNSDVLDALKEEVLLPSGKYFTLKFEHLRYAASMVTTYIDTLYTQYIRDRYEVIGCTSMFQQTAASLSIIRQVKKNSPKMITIMGGANCAGEMAVGIAKLSTDIDFIFSGESESTFVQFLDEIDQCGRQKDSLLKKQGRVIFGEPCKALDEIPNVCFDDYFEELKRHNVYRHNWNIHLPYESSRGCWWGEKKQCTFCSVHELGYRFKSPNNVKSQLKELTQKYPGFPISFFDDIMPRQYFRKLLPQLRDEIPSLRFFIDQKANMTLEKVKLLADAGAYGILPGIESLSTSILNKVSKGTKARQNIALLRYGRSCNIYLLWYFLYGIPGDTYEDYEKQVDLIPLLSHLDPPRFIQEVDFLRYSVYIMNPKQFGIKNIKPWKSYKDIFPENYDCDELAYYFDGEFQSFTKDSPEYVNTLRKVIMEWRLLWINPDKEMVIPPCLSIEISGSEFVLTDTRPIHRESKQYIISEEMAATALVAQPLNRLKDIQWEVHWGIEQKVCVNLDNYLVPLATAQPKVLQYFEKKYGGIELKQEIGTLSLCK